LKKFVCPECGLKFEEFVPFEGQIECPECGTIVFIVGDEE